MVCLRSSVFQVNVFRVYVLCAALLMSGTTLADALTVTTAEGTLRGVWTDEARQIRAFRGVPYALPPTGERRWAPPEKVAPWQGTRPAEHFGAACPQHEARDAFVWSRGDFRASEDCLVLNVWSPARGGQRKPVMVWFHGGAHTTGYAHAEIFEGTELAAHDVVVVTVNYRLGALGFLAHPALGETSGNYGLMDKVAALEWVQRNIAAFGGDRENVTVFGQSAGSQSVCALMAAPSARGLFHKAIGQSAACVLPPGEGDLAGLERGAALAESALGTTPVTAESLRALPVERVLEAELASNWAARSRITVDGAFLPEHPSVTFSEGRQAPVPLMVGSLADEGEQLIPLMDGLSLEQLTGRLARMFGEHGQAVLDAYAEQLKRSPAHLLREVLADQFFALAMQTWAEQQTRIGQPSYLYFMSHVPPAFKLYDPADPNLNLPGGPRSGGAYHSGDLAFVFGNTRVVGTDMQEADHTLSAAMTKYWIQFARTGNPNSDGAPAWAPYEPERKRTLVLDDPITMVDGVRNEKLKLIGQQPR